MTGDPCELCATAGGTVLWNGRGCRIVRVDDPHYPGFCRVIRDAHVREMTDLAPGDRAATMSVVFAVEQVLRDLYSPDKVNIASFGNVTPHVHWHVIPRWRDDRHFPEPVWGAVHNERPPERPVVTDTALANALARALAAPIEGE